MRERGRGDGNQVVLRLTEHARVRPQHTDLTSGEELVTIFPFRGPRVLRSRVGGQSNVRMFHGRRVLDEPVDALPHEHDLLQRFDLALKVEVLPRRPLRGRRRGGLRHRPLSPLPPNPGREIF